jgi:hypothetical protein
VNRLLSASVALVLMAAPPGAIAQQPATNAPPGNSAIDEYLETVPGATGNQRPRPPSDGSAPGPLTPAQRARLEGLGPDGKALVSVVEATSPARTSTRQRPTAPADAHGRSPLGAVIGAAGGHDGGAGMGFVLPAILLASLLAIVALVVARRRSGP